MVRAYETELAGGDGGTSLAAAVDGVDGGGLGGGADGDAEFDVAQVADRAGGLEEHRTRLLADVQE